MSAGVFAERIVFALLLGVAIGIERRSRQRIAEDAIGIRRVAYSRKESCRSGAVPFDMVFFSGT
jgi:hypothetical protein